jgi:hypothetical protein
MQHFSPEFPVLHRPESVKRICNNDLRDKNKLVNANQILKSAAFCCILLHLLSTMADLAWRWLGLRRTLAAGLGLHETSCQTDGYGRLAAIGAAGGAEFASALVDAGDAGSCAAADRGVWRAGGRAGAAYG